MTNEEAKEELARRLSKKPFEAFRIVVSTGERFDVVESRGQLGFGAAQFGYVDRTAERILNRRLSQIVAIEAIEGAAATV